MSTEETKGTTIDTIDTIPTSIRPKSSSWSFDMASYQKALRRMSAYLREIKMHNVQYGELVKSVERFNARSRALQQTQLHLEKITTQYGIECFDHEILTIPLHDTTANAATTSNNNNSVDVTAQPQPTLDDEIDSEQEPNAVHKQIQGDFKRSLRRQSLKKKHVQPVPVQDIDTPPTMHA